MSNNRKIRVAVVGVGNCCSSLIQGFGYYADASAENPIPGVMLHDIGGYTPGDIEVVAAFDVDHRKIGKTLTQAIFEKPNCTPIFNTKWPKDFTDPLVRPAPIMDGVAPHMYQYSDEEAFRDYRWAYNIGLIDTEELGAIESSISRELTAQHLVDEKVDVLINYLPVGSQQATEFWANICLQTGISFLNCIPVFIASDPVWEKKFIDQKIPLIGDDMRSQFGASILSAVLQQLAIERGHSINVHIQQNSGGNTDFLNMVDKNRLSSKKISKTNVITSQSDLQGYKDKPNSIHAGPSEYIRYYKDNKVATFRLEMEGFGGAPVTLDARLSVIDSPNSAGVVIDAIRHLKVAREMGIVGALRGPSAYTQKTPPVQMLTADARMECIHLAARRLTVLTRDQVRPGQKVKEFCDSYVKGDGIKTSENTSVAKNLRSLKVQGSVEVDELGNIQKSHLEIMADDGVL